MIKILENLILGDTEWKIAPFKFNVDTLNFVGGGETPSYEDVVASGTNSLTLTNAKANSLSYLKLFGACSQASTPTPTSPVNIVCNNGTIKVRDKELPSGYKRVKDIIYNNNSYFESAYTMSGSDTMKISFTKTTSGACNLVGAYDGATPVNTNYSIYLSNLTNGRYLRYNGNLYNSYAIQDTRYDLIMTPTGTQGMEVDSTWEEKEFTSTNTFCIGTTAVSATSSKFVGVIHGNVEIVNRATFIPCERESDSALGYYDTTAQVFLENQGTGTLTTSGYDFDNLEIYVDGTVETVQMTYPDSTTSEAVTAQNLLGLGDYQDIQEVLTGHVTRKIGMMILTGEEDWSTTSSATTFKTPLRDNPEYEAPDSEIACMCTHYNGEKPKVTVSSMSNNTIKCGYKNAGYTPTGYIYLKDSSFGSVSDVTDYLAGQYANGTPVILVYPLDVTTTETVTAHHLQVKEGDNVVTITQASINPLGLEAKYKALVVPTTRTLGEYMVSPTTTASDKYILADGSLLTTTTQPDYVNDIKALYEDDPTQACFQQPIKIYNYELSGTVSDNNGVLSGFTPYSTNYAYIYKPFTTSGKPWNIIVDFTMGNNTSSSQGIYGTLTKDIIALHISGGTLKGYITSSGGSNWNVANGVSLLAMSANTQYRIKTEFTGTAYNWYQYVNDEWTLLNSVTNSSAIADGYTLMFGSNRKIGDPFLGSIDMNNTSITIDGSTSVALETQTGETAWQTVNTYNGCNGTHVYDPINETVRIPHLGSYITSSENYGQIVGNLTINNGVVSGFSNDNYILTPEFDVTSASKWQIQLTFTTGTMGTQSSLLFPTENYMMEPFIIMANAGWLAYISTNGTSWNIDSNLIFTLSANTEYKLLAEYTGSYYRFYQWNGSSWTQKKSISNSNKVKKKAQFRLGMGFNGSINLKESYFSIDGVKTYPIKPKQKVNYYLKVKE